MVDHGRRHFLKGAAASAATTLLGAGCSGGGSSDADPGSTADHRVLIIGSGFGGGISALRLAQAGIASTILERGRRWETGPNAETFPHAGKPDKRVLWYTTAKKDSATRYAGLLEPVASSTMTVMCACGVGGGSLVYQGMTLQPPEALFKKCFPAGIDYAEMDSVFYPRVASMLHVATAPDELVNSPSYLAPRVFKRNAERAGYTVDKIPMPIDWTYALRELNGEMKASYTNGDCALGVNNGGKFSVDVTYIAAAEATGLVKVETLHNVTGVARTANGLWQVSVDVTDETGKVLESKVMTAKALIMAAGSVNTTKLLVRASAQGKIPDMPAALGKGWGTNADRIYIWNNKEDDFGAEQGGPVVYGSKEWGDPDLANTVIQASVPPMGFDTRSTMLVGFGISAARGSWNYDSITQEVHLDWKREGDSVIQARINERVHAIAGSTSKLIDTNALVPSTWHPLGGACMETVCDLEGRVHNQPGLYVLDGALIPGATSACNPSMTIAAIVERALDRIVKNDIGTLI